MIDYIDAKNHEGREKAQIPHLPWSCERSLPKYRPSKPISHYTSEEVVRLSRKAAAQAQQDLINARVAIRTPFSVKKTADAARVTKHIQPDTVVERENLRYTQRLEEIRFQERRDYLRMLHHIQRMDENQVAISAELKRAIRGKSAHAITAALLAETDRNLKNARAEEEAFIAAQSAARASSVTRKQTAIEIEQLNARVVEAETRLKTEVMRIKKKLQIQITELEMSLDVANKQNIDLQKIIKKQSLQLTELQAAYEDVQRQLQQVVDQNTVAQRRLQTLSGELEEARVNLDSATRAKRAVEIQYEDAQTRISELSTININLQSSKVKIEQELAVVASDYEEITKELRISDERYQKVQVELKHTVEILHEEQERIVKIETIKKSLETEVKEGVSQQSVTRVRRFQRELEAAEDRAENAETNLNMIRAKHRTFVTTSTVPGTQVYMVESTSRTITE
uniref:Myosin tail domain-containing protein n=1 Tax=Megaselia scalaris TaxID=36166 RepID=T1GPK4_MEGSC